jgi:hypothetical protein
MKPRTILCVAALAFLLASAGSVAAQDNGSAQVTNLPPGQTVTMTTYPGPKATTQPFTTTVSSNGPIPGLQGLIGPNKPHIQMKSWKCPGPNDTIVIISLPATDGNPCPQGKEIGVWWLDGKNLPVFNLTAGNESVTQQTKTTMGTSAGNRSKFKFGLGIFGGDSDLRGHDLGYAGFYGSPLWNLGHDTYIGPYGGFNWQGHGESNAFGGGPPPSTFGFSKYELWGGNVGLQVDKPVGHWDLAFLIGLEAALAKTTTSTGFCGGSSSSSSSTCTVSSSTSANATVVGPQAGFHLGYQTGRWGGPYFSFQYTDFSNSAVNNTHACTFTGGWQFRFGSR